MWHQGPLLLPGLNTLAFWCTGFLQLCSLRDELDSLSSDASPVFWLVKNLVTDLIPLVLLQSHMALAATATAPDSNWLGLSGPLHPTLSNLSAPSDGLLVPN